MVGIAQNNVLLANSVEAPSDTSEGTITQLEALDAADIEATTLAETVTAVIRVNFLSVSIDSNSETSAPAIAQHQEILSVSTESASEVTENTLTQVSVFNAVDVETQYLLTPRPVLIDLKPIEQDTTRTLLVPSESRTTIVGRAA